MNKYSAHGVVGSRNSSTSNSSHSNSTKTRRQHQQQQQRGAESLVADGAVNVGNTVQAQAHTVLPGIVREPSVLESFSRNLRTFLPALSLSHSPPSPSISSQSQSQSQTYQRPRRPLSFGSFNPTEDPTSLAAPPHHLPVHPQGESDEPITWAGWDTLGGLRVLVLVYPTGLQVWDTTNLAAVKELVNLKVESLKMNAGSVKKVVVLPEPKVEEKQDEAQDQLKGSRPIMGILSSAQLTLFSLVSYTVVAQIPFKHATHIVARPSFTVVSTSGPPALHVLSTRTFQILHTVLIPSTSTSPFPGTVAPIFTLSHRLLAYASPSPPSDVSIPLEPTFVASDEYMRSRVGVGVGSASASVGRGIASSVVKLGGGVWSGVKGMVDAALAGSGASGDVRHAGANIASGQPLGSDLSLPPAGAYGYGFSRSAPAQGSWRDEPEGGAGLSGMAGNRGSSMSSGGWGWVTVLDLDPLLRSHPAREPPPHPPLLPPRHITSFIPFPSSTVSSASHSHSSTPYAPHSIAYLSFHTVNGTSGSNGPVLYVAPQHGHHIAVFQIRPSLSLHLPSPSPTQVSSSPPFSTDGNNETRTSHTHTNAKPWHVYDLHRGVTGARIESVGGGEERSGRWVGVVTARRTLHIFATNPYGGKPTRGHLSSQIRNATQLQPLSTSLHSIARIRPTTASTATSANSNLGFGSTPTPSSPLNSPSGSRSNNNNFSDDAPLSQVASVVPSLIGPSSTPAPPVIFTFLPPSTTHALPSALLPLPHSYTPSHGQSVPSSASSSPRSYIHSHSYSYNYHSQSPTGGRGLPLPHIPTASNSNNHNNNNNGGGGGGGVGSPGIALPPVQDVLVFDPLSGEMALRRVWLEWVAGSAGNGVGFGEPFALTGRSGGGGKYGYSVSLPVPIRGIAGIGERNWGKEVVRREGEEEGEEEEGELVGREGVVAVWGLRRGWGWGEIKGWKWNDSVRKEKEESSRIVMRKDKGNVTDYLSQAELTTHSHLSTILPRSIYLSHQFSFYTFAVDGGDYHPLLLRGHLDIPSTRLDMRKDVVAINATPTTTPTTVIRATNSPPNPVTDAFIHGAIDLQDNTAGELPSSSPPFTHTHARHRSSLSTSSFDTPLSSAIHTTLDYSGQSPPVLPMFPNGATSAAAASGVGVALTSLPGRTRHVAQGVNEGLKVFKREIIERKQRRRRSTRGATGVTPGVGLQFEGDEDTVFLVDPEESDGEGSSAVAVGAKDKDDSGGSGASVSISTPGSGAFAGDLPAVNPATEDSWDAWDDEAHATIAEAEMFDEISVAGFLDEEQAEERKWMEGVMRQGRGLVSRGGVVQTQMEVQAKMGTRTPQGLVEAQFAPELEPEPEVPDEFERKAENASVVKTDKNSGATGKDKKGRKKGKGRETLKPEEEEEIMNE